MRHGEIEMFVMHPAENAHLIQWSVELVQSYGFFPFSVYIPSGIIENCLQQYSIMHGIFEKARRNHEGLQLNESL